jgi:hypothetical protein
MGSLHQNLEISYKVRKNNARSFASRIQSKKLT